MSAKESRLIGVLAGQQVETYSLQPTDRAPQPATAGLARVGAVSIAGHRRRPFDLDYSLNRLTTVWSSTERFVSS